MRSIRSNLAVSAAMLLFATTLCATGAVTAFRASSSSVPAASLDSTDDAAVALRPAADRPTSGAFVQSAAQHGLNAYQVRLAADGNLPCRVNVVDPTTGTAAVAEEVTIRLLQNGETIREEKPGVSGICQIPKVTPGVYSVVVSGECGFLAYAVHVLPALRDEAANVTATDTLQLDGTLVARKDLSAMYDLVKAYLHRDLNTNDATDALAIRPVAAIDAKPVVGAASTPLRNYRVALTDDGRVAGRVSRLATDDGTPYAAANTTLFFIRDGQLSGQTVTEDDGQFAIGGLLPGVFSVIAAGPEGLAAFGLKVQQAPLPNETNETAGLTHGAVVSTVSAVKHDHCWSDDECDCCVDVALCCPCDCEAAWECCECPAPECLECAPPPLFVGGGVGGGGHGCGGGVLMGLLAGAAGGAIASAIIDDDDDYNYRGAVDSQSSSDSNSDANGGGGSCGSCCSCGGCCTGGCRMKSPFDPYPSRCHVEY